MAAPTVGGNGSTRSLFCLFARIARVPLCQSTSSRHSCATSEDRSPRSSMIRRIARSLCPAARLPSTARSSLRHSRLVRTSGGAARFQFGILGQDRDRPAGHSFSNSRNFTKLRRDTFMTETELGRIDGALTRMYVRKSVKRRLAGSNLLPLKRHAKNSRAYRRRYSLVASLSPQILAMCLSNRSTSEPDGPQSPRQDERRISQPSITINWRNAARQVFSVLLAGSGQRQHAKCDDKNSATSEARTFLDQGCACERQNPKCSTACVY